MGDGWVGDEKGRGLEFIYLISRRGSSCMYLPVLGVVYMRNLKKLFKNEFNILEHKE